MLKGESVRKLEMKRVADGAVTQFLCKSWYGCYGMCATSDLRMVIGIVSIEGGQEYEDDYY